MGKSSDAMCRSCSELVGLGDIPVAKVEADGDTWVPIFRFERLYRGYKDASNGAPQTTHVEASGTFQPQRYDFIPRQSGKQDRRPGNGIPEHFGLKNYNREGPQTASVINFGSIRSGTCDQ